MMNKFFIVLAFSYTMFCTASISRPQVLQAVRELDQSMAQGMDQLPVPGAAVAVIYGDEVLFLKGYGVREAGKGVPVDGDTIFQLASVSKPITSSVLGAIVGEGKVRWDSLIVSLDPSFRLSDPWVTRHVTVADFLSHRSGLFAHAGDLLEDLGYDEKTIIHQLRIPRLNPFRASYAYTNFGFSEAAFATANALNKQWSDLAKEKLFIPLRMHTASYSFEDYQKAANKAVSHQVRENGALSLTIRNPDPQAPAGGASMSIKDLAKWMIFSLNGGAYGKQQVVSQQVLLETQNPYIVSELDALEDKVNFYGLGWGVKYNAHGHKVLSHSGAFLMGVRSEVLLIPELKIGIAILCNSSPHAFPEAVAQSFLDLIYTGKVQKDWFPLLTKKFVESMQAERQQYAKPDEGYIPNLDLGRYAGRYYNEYFGELRVVSRLNQLVLIIGPKSLEFPLRHYHKDTFVMKTEGENSVGETKVVFAFGANGLIKRLTVDYLNDHGLGVFSPIRERG